MEYPWDGIITSPLTGRATKPRLNGMTMVIDKGLPLIETEDWLKLTSSFIDFLKLSFGTAALYQTDLIKRKMELTLEHHVMMYPGGTFFEIAVWENQLDFFLTRLQELGFKWLEISDGTLEISFKKRREIIRKAIDYGFKVITEVGKKDPKEQPADQFLIETALSDLDLGVQWVIIEARESGKGIGIFDTDGAVIEAKTDVFADKLPLEKIIWEAPLKNQQAILINRYGTNVNLGNIAPAEALALEALRRGYRSDTWKNCLIKNN